MKKFGKQELSSYLGGMKLSLRHTSAFLIIAGFCFLASCSSSDERAVEGESRKINSDMHFSIDSSLLGKELRLEGIEYPHVRLPRGMSTEYVSSAEECFSPAQQLGWKDSATAASAGLSFVLSSDPLDTIAANVVLCRKRDSTATVRSGNFSIKGVAVHQVLTSNSSSVTFDLFFRTPTSKDTVWRLQYDTPTLSYNPEYARSIESSIGTLTFSFTTP